MHSFTAGQVRRSIQRFLDFGNDLISSDMNSFDDRLNLFMDFCKTDDVFSCIHRQLTSMPEANFNDWYQRVLSTIGSMAGSGKLTFPTDIEARLSLMYQLLTRVQAKEIDLYDLAIKFFALGTNKLTAYVQAFNQTITLPMIRELKYRLEDLEDTLPENKKETVSPSIIQVIHNATNVIQQNAIGNDISQTANQTQNTQLNSLLEKLEKEISSIADEQKRTDANMLLESIALEAKSSKPRMPILGALLNSLPAIGSIAEVSQSIIELLGNIC